MSDISASFSRVAEQISPEKPSVLVSETFRFGTLAMAYDHEAQDYTETPGENGKCLYFWRASREFGQHALLLIEEDQLSALEKLPKSGDSFAIKGTRALSDNDYEAISHGAFVLTTHGYEYIVKVASLEPVAPCDEPVENASPSQPNYTKALSAAFAMLSLLRLRP